MIFSISQYECKCNGDAFNNVHVYTSTMEIEEISQKTYINPAVKTLLLRIPNHTYYPGQAFLSF